MAPTYSPFFYYDKWDPFVSVYFLFFYDKWDLPGFSLFHSFLPPLSLQDIQSHNGT